MLFKLGDTCFSNPQFPNTEILIGSRERELSGSTARGVMRSTRFERLTRWGLGALSLLLFHGLCATRAVAAGCEHFVFSRPDLLLDYNRLDALIAGGAADPAHDPLKQAPTSPRPCSGPGCSSRVPAPVPTGFSGSDRSDQWGDLSTLATLPITSPPSRTIDEPVVRPTGQTPSIFHPPPA
jgi:hypothetical protein